MSLSKFSTEIGIKTKKRTFIEVNDEYVKEAHQAVQNKNSKKGEKSAETAFTQYLETVKCDRNDSWNFLSTELNAHLSKFWFAVRQAELDPETLLPKKYKVQSLKTLRYSLNRVCKERSLKHNIIFGPDFTESQVAFDNACKQLKAEGYGYVIPTKEITPQGN